ncbi:MAG: 16S rRNA (cytosine(967)-C(5))-methyltransferase RsmB [Acholeplasmataceae bacterium]|nr:16S rRNA (cytosine(967)-C(5))-methyltransferase RsmB [Acholeplasmataceae bacterium]
MRLLMQSKTDNARLLALTVINSVFTDGAYANLALNKALNNTILTDIDRRFVTELVYGTIKAKGTIDWFINQAITRPLHKVSPMILNILREGVYQIYFLERIPVSAACNEAVNLAKKFGHPGTVKFVNGVLRSIVRNKERLVFPTMEENEPLHIALTYNHPEWLVQRWRYRFGTEETIALCKYDNENPALSLRVNTLLITREELKKRLEAEGVEVRLSNWCKEGLVCGKIPSFAAIMSKFGQYIYIQDESSMLVAGILAPEPGNLVIDVCSAPGGKTTHLAQLMKNTGKVIATDIYAHKLNLVVENAERLALRNIETREQDASIVVGEWREAANCVLVDAPCSGLGVLSRRAEARWTKTEKDLNFFPPLQKKILASASSYVKPGGRLVYSTCTLEANENGRVIEDFLSKHTEFTRLNFKHPLTGETISELQLLPQKDGIDGFYICLLGRK